MFRLPLLDLPDLIGRFVDPASATTASDAGMASCSRTAQCRIKQRSSRTVERVRRGFMMNLNDDRLFYHHLPPIREFGQIFQFDHYQPVPETWLVVMSDIQGSTEAIRQGRYKEVNLLGAMTIAGLLNLAPEMELPFVFGGDGATLLLPASLAAPARQVLSATVRLARNEFGLTLRAGMIPMTVIHQAGQEIRVACLSLAERSSQALMMGNGLALAEALLKDPSATACRVPEAQADEKADYSGLECRWQNLLSPQGEMVSLLVEARSPVPAEQKEVYTRVLAAIETLCGSSGQRRPVAPDQLKLTFAAQSLDLENRVHHPAQNLWQRLVRRWKLRLENSLGQLLMHTWKGTNWSAYPALVAATSDCEKFDGLLRMIFASQPRRRLELTALLEQWRQQGDLHYGLHTSEQAHMTCLVYQRMGRQFHFVDGADGGYAVAAVMLKKQRAASLT
ncbi:MAG: DUF3095 domain-containing protein [Magnetococcales bacterium]|nr:DUF3095 domain-containing protein [Magnetococcales bacterium]